jgi:hypothetical protein
MDRNAMNSVNNINDLQDQKIRTPERNLLVAMIQRAIFDYMGNREFDRDSAAEWLFDDTENSDLFSFQWVCSQLDLEPQAITSRVKQMTPRESMHCQRWWGMQRYGDN